MSKALLIQMPFHSLRRPCIGLSLVKGALKEAGYDCEIRYLNLEFAPLIGEQLFQTISESLP